MIRQAHTYLAGAVSGTVLIAIAVAIFVMLVSVQATRDWPFAGLVGGDDASTSVEPGDAGGRRQATGATSAGPAGRRRQLAARGGQRQRRRRRPGRRRSRST